MGGARRGSTVVTGDGGVAGSKEKPFDTMNNIVANLLLNLTRYNGAFIVGWTILSEVSSFQGL